MPTAQVPGAAIHLDHLGASEKPWDRGRMKSYVYRLDGVQLKSLSEEKR